MDIAGSNRIHYLKFSLPGNFPGKEKDKELQEFLKEYESKPDLIEGVHFYINKDGYIVLTEKYHLEKGICCGMGCLHCPIIMKMFLSLAVHYYFLQKINKQNNLSFPVETSA